MNAYRLIPGYRGFHHLGHKAPISFSQSDPAVSAFRQRFSPSGPGSCRIQHSQEAGVFADKHAAQFIGIFFAGRRDFVQKTFGNECILRMSHGPPEAYGNTRFITYVLDPQIGYVVGKIG